MAAMDKFLDEIAFPDEKSKTDALEILSKETVKPNQIDSISDEEFVEIGLSLEIVALIRQAWSKKKQDLDVPKPALEYQDIAGFPGRTFSHELEGDAPHTLAITFETEPHVLCGSLGREHLSRRWIATLGQNGLGSEHWIYSTTDMPLQLGVWSPGVVAGCRQIFDSDTFDLPAFLSGARRPHTLATVHDPDRGAYTLYIDGEAVARLTPPPAFNLTEPVLRVGHDAHVDGVDFGGAVFHVALWHTPLPPDAVRAVSARMTAAARGE